MKTRLLPIILLTLLLVACGGATSQSTQQNLVTQAPGGATAPEAAPVAPAENARGASFDDAQKSGESTANTGTGQSQIPNDQRLVIKNANLSLEVKSVSEAETLVRAKVQELGGYVVQVQTFGSGTDMTSQITFRVPAEQFDNALNGVQGIANRVLSRTLSGDDVTEEYVDLESRLRNLEATRTRLLDLLQKATRVEDALQVNQALTDVQGQIEQIQGRMKYLRQNAALSTITVALQPVPVTPIIEDDAWQPLRVARIALRDLLEFGTGLLNIGIVLLVWTPVWLPLLLIGRWVLRRLGRAMRRPISPAPAATPSDTPPAA